jgi:hypothetical protein
MRIEVIADKKINGSKKYKHNKEKNHRLEAIRESSRKKNSTTLQKILIAMAKRPGCALFPPFVASACSSLVKNTKIHSKYPNQNRQYIY